MVLNMIILTISRSKKKKEKRKTTTTKHSWEKGKNREFTQDLQILGGKKQ